MVNDLRGDLYAHLQRLSLAFHTRQRVGDLMYRITSDSFAVQTMIMNGLLPILSALVLLAAAPALFILSYLTFLPVYARDILAIGAPGLGLLTGSIGIGALAGALLMASRRPGGGSGRLLLAGLVAMSLSLTTFALSRFVPLTCVALAVLGASQVAYYSTTNTLLQTRVPARLRGRVHSLYVLTSIGLLPLGNLVAGAIAERLTVPPVLAAGGVATLAIAILAAVLRPELAWLTPGGAGQASPAEPGASSPLSAPEVAEGRVEA
jgi:ABC-type multidrug transport system fused ATPase/permease subunit